jgi:hypothetical protein
MELPNIYTVLDKIEFEKKVADMVETILQTQNENPDAMQMISQQNMFSIIQQFYNVVLRTYRENYNKHIT